MKSVSLILFFIIGYINIALADSSVYNPFYPNHSLPVFNEENRQITSPFAGGIAKPVISNLDLNGNGILDLLVLDRKDESITAFLNAGTPGNPRFVYAGYYVEKLPANDIHEFLITYDYNNNGLMDIFTYRGLPGLRAFRNISQNGNLEFEIAADPLQFIRRNGTRSGIAFTRGDIPAFADVSGDGTMDILSFGGIGPMNYYRNISYDSLGHYDSLYFRFETACWGRFAEDAADTNKVVYGEEFDLRPWCDDVGKKHTGGTLLALDLNNSGAKDLVLGDIDFPVLQAVINGRTLIGDGNYPTDTIIDLIHPFPENNPVNVPEMPAAYYVDVDNSGVKDLIVAPVRQSEYTKPLNQVWYYRNNGQDDNPDFEFIQNNFLQDQMIDEGVYSKPVFTDINANGQTDLIITAHTGPGELVTDYGNTKMVHYIIEDGEKPALKRSSGYLFEFPDNEDFNYPHPAFGDLTGNGIPDMIIGTRNGTLQFFENNSNPGEMPDFVHVPGKLDYIDAGEYTAPFLFDYNGNGLSDLFIGNKTGNVLYLENTGTSSDPDFTLVSDSLGQIRVSFSFVAGDGSIVYQDGYAIPAVADINKDGNYEIIVGSRDIGVQVFRTENDPDAAFEKVKDLFYHYTEERPMDKIHSRHISPAFHIFGPDSIAGLFMGTIRGGLIHYSSEDDGALPDTAVSIADEYKEGYWKLYPNPAQNHIIIELKEGATSQGGKVVLYDLLGRKVLEHTIERPFRKTEINTDELNPSVYIVRMSDLNGNEVFNTRVIIQ